MPLERSTAKIAIISPVILVLAILSISLNSLSSPVALSAFPEVPREGEPIILSFSLKNLDLKETTYAYEFYANGKKILEGSAVLRPLSSKQYSYAYRNPLKLGEQVTFLLKAAAPSNTYEETLSMPAYPPQVWSSFVSFATFSTSMAGMSSSMGLSSSMGSSMGMSLTSMAYYQNSFGTNKAFNVGVIFSVVLIMILIHVELTEPFMKARNLLGRLRARFNKLSAILFIIFVAMVFTQIIMIIG